MRKIASNFVLSIVNNILQVCNIGEIFCRNRYNTPLTSIFAKYQSKYHYGSIRRLLYGSLLVFILSYDIIRVKDLSRNLYFYTRNYTICIVSKDIN